MCGLSLSPLSFWPRPLDTRRETKAQPRAPRRARRAGVCALRAWRSAVPTTIIGQRTSIAYLRRTVLYVDRPVRIVAPSAEQALENKRKRETAHATTRPRRVGVSANDGVTANFRRSVGGRASSAVYAHAARAAAAAARMRAGERAAPGQSHGPGRARGRDARVPEAHGAVPRARGDEPRA